MRSSLGSQPRVNRPAEAFIRHRVDDLDLPVRHPGIDNLDRGDDEVDRPDHIGNRRLFRGQVPAHDEGDLGLDLGRDQAALRYLFAIGERHIGEQHAEVGLVDPQLLLHHLRGQPDLAPDQAPPGGQRPLGVDLLHPIGHRHIVLGQQVTHRRDRDPALGGLEQTVGHGANGPCRFPKMVSVRLWLLASSWCLPRFGSSNSARLASNAGMASCRLILRRRYG